MKDIGLRAERDDAFYKTYLDACRTMTFTGSYAAAEWCRNQPAPQFYISAHSLCQYFARIESGDTLDSFHASTREKVLELYRRYRDFIAEHRHCSISRKDICRLLASQPAPKYYINIDSAYQIIVRKGKEQKELMINKFTK